MYRFFVSQSPISLSFQVFQNCRHLLLNSSFDVALTTPFSSPCHVPKALMFLLTQKGVYFVINGFFVISSDGVLVAKKCKIRVRTRLFLLELGIGPIIVGEFRVLLCRSCKCLYVEFSKIKSRIYANDGWSNILSISVSCLSHRSHWFRSCLNESYKRISEGLFGFTFFNFWK